MKLLSDVKLTADSRPTTPTLRTGTISSRKMHVYRQKLAALKQTPSIPPQPAASIPISWPPLPQIAEFTAEPNSNHAAITNSEPGFKAQPVKDETYGNIHLNQMYSQIAAVDKDKKSIRKKKRNKKMLRAAVSATMITAGIALLLTQFNLPLPFFNPTPQVAGVTSKQPADGANEEYKNWIISKVGSYQPPEADYDHDGLTNMEEMALGSDPGNPVTCGSDKTDSQNFFNLIDPVTCKPMDLNNQDDLTKFSRIVRDAQSVQTFIQTAPTEAKGETNAPETSSSSDILNLFGVKDYADVQSISVKELADQNAQNQKKIEYLKTVARINSYMRAYRSYDVLDRNWPIPVDGAKYLEVSLKYKTPLKYMLAIARAESRFGTDVHTSDGGLTRPGQHRNIYSMGLTDSGSNITFATWEDGVESFGKWYRKMDDKGISDCRKWKIYNPNGDYCGKIEGLASEIDAYLKKTE